MKKIGVSIVFPVLMNAFRTLWEYPSQQCHNVTHGRKNYTIDFGKYNITTNTNFTFDGDKIVIFYEEHLGHYPYYINYSMDHPVNGGLPQNCNLAAHLKQAEEDIKNRIPDVNFSGLAIIDFEKWRPLFSENDWKKKRVFQNESIRKYSGTPNGTYINETDYHKYYNVAEVEFNEHAKNFFTETINLGKRIRQNAKWGYYGFPYCNYDAGNRTLEFECRDKWKKWNDEMDFIFQESQALFPSVYLGTDTRTQKPRQRFRYVLAVLREAKRIAKHYRNIPIYAYTKFEYNQLNSTSDFYDTHDLCAGIAQPAFLGIDGLILWSSSNNMKNRCEGIKNEVDDKVGPLISEITAAHTRCSKELCNNTAKCIRRGFRNDWCPLPRREEWKFTYEQAKYSCECNRPKIPGCIKVESHPPKKMPKSTKSLNPKSSRR